MGEEALRLAIVAACREMNAAGINQGKSGNISVRHGGMMLITPSAVACEAMRPEDIAAMALDDAPGDAPGDASVRACWQGPRKPSTEWRFHRDILRARPEAGAIVHAHPPYCTALAMARRGIPACHYMIARFGGGDVRLADYANFGTEALSRHALAALAGRSACLLANHGMIAFGRDLPAALLAAIELEALARHYCLSLAIGGPHLLSGTEVAAAAESFRTYGSSDGSRNG